MIETHKDDSYFSTGTHKRGSSASLVDPGNLFVTFGVAVGMLIKNTTDSSEGAITAVTEDEIEVTLTGGTNNTWESGDTYEIYLTGTYNSVISSIGVDNSRGWKVTDKKELNDYGFRPEDADIDRDSKGHRLPNNKIPFGPGQPSRSR